MSEQNTIESVAKLAVEAAKAAMICGDEDVYDDMNDTDVTALAVALIHWDAARLAASAAESRRKPTPPEARC